jgi:hypothetical protein
MNARGFSLLAPVLFADCSSKPADKPPAKDTPEKRDEGSPSPADKKNDPGQPDLKGPGKRKGETLRDVRTLLEWRRGHIQRGTSTDNVDEELSKTPEMPRFRQLCRKLFNTKEASDQTIDEIMDRMNVEDGLSREKCLDLRMPEVLKKLEAWDKHK